MSSQHGRVVAGTDFVPPVVRPAWARRTRSSALCWPEHSLSRLNVWKHAVCIDRRQVLRDIAAIPLLFPMLGSRSPFSRNFFHFGAGGVVSAADDKDDELTHRALAPRAKFRCCPRRLLAPRPASPLAACLQVRGCERANIDMEFLFLARLGATMADPLNPCRVGRPVVARFDLSIPGSV